MLRFMSSIVTCKPIIFKLTSQFKSRNIYSIYVSIHLYIFYTSLYIYAISKFNFQNIYISLLKNLQFQEAVLIKMKLSSELNLKSSAYLCRLLIDPVFAGCEFGIGYMSASSLLVQLWNHRT